MAIYSTNSKTLRSNNDALYEVVMLADQYGNPVQGGNSAGMAVDAFGRSRVSQPFTLFDSFSRYDADDKILSSTTGGATVTYEEHSSSVLMTVSASGDQVIRETSRTFAYQPGKSLQILNTFCLAATDSNVRQRVGYFSSENGIFIQQVGTQTSLVLRSKSSGSVVETIVNQADWNMDKLDGSGVSRKTLDPTKSHIFFVDIEWLGVGSVRAGFVIDGQLLHCHTFHHANNIETTYMTTACLPCRAEITATGTTAPVSMRQICMSVISEGGYDLRGKPLTINLPVNAPKDMPVANTYYPILSVRLKNTRLDGIVIPRGISLSAVGNNGYIHYRLVSGTTLTGANWVSAGANSCIEYDMSATAVTGGSALSSGYTAITNQSVAQAELGGDIFKFQLERNSFTGEGTILTLEAASNAAGNDLYASFNLEEIT